MANQPTPRTLQAPPDLPNMPDVSSTLSSYLRNFALWCRHGFADKLSGSQALPGIMLQANDPPAGTAPEIWMLQVRTGGVFVVTQVPLGGGKP
jgi:hypothetical protein